MHAKRQFVALDARVQLVVIRVALFVNCVQTTQQVEVLALVLGSDASRGIHIQHGGSLCPERRSLVVRGQKAVGPVRRTALRVGNVRQDDESRQVLVLGPQPVGHPRPYCWISAEAVPRVEVIKRRGMVDALGLQAAIEADVVNDVREMREARVDIDTELADALELERTLDVVALARIHRRGELRPFLGELRHVQLVQLRFRIERVDVGRAALHQQEDTALGFGPVVGLPWGERSCPAQQGRQRDGAEPQPGPIQDIAPCPMEC